MTVLLLSVGTTWADRFEDAVAAYDRGEYAIALKTFRPLAEQGNALAQYNLGMLYIVGQGVAQDYVRAHFWLNLAAGSGHEDALKNRDLVAIRMTPEQIADAQTLARECPRQKFKGCD